MVHLTSVQHLILRPVKCETHDLQIWAPPMNAQLTVERHRHLVYLIAEVLELLQHLSRGALQILSNLLLLLRRQLGELLTQVSIDDILHLHTSRII